MTPADLKELFSPIGDIIQIEIYTKAGGSESSVTGLVETSRLRDISAFKVGFGFRYESSLFFVQSIVESSPLSDAHRTTVVVTLGGASGAY